MTCEGNCEEHTGEVKRVKVWDGTKYWCEFNYCEEAIKKDIKHGLTVEEVTFGG